MFTKIWVLTKQCVCFRDENRNLTDKHVGIDQHQQYIVKLYDWLMSINYTSYFGVNAGARVLTHSDGIIWVELI